MTRPFIAAVCVLPLAAGCGPHLNEQIGLVGAGPLPALAETAEPTRGSREPSLPNGFDRRSWPLVTVQVPTHQVAHYPTYTRNVRWRQDRGPWNPAYPTAVDALNDPVDPGADVADAAAQPFVAAALLVWAPIDMIFINQPWTPQVGPREAYALVPAPAANAVWHWFDYQATPPDIEWRRDARQP